jgi:hypothetical protein
MKSERLNTTQVVSYVNYNKKGIATYAMLSPISWIDENKIGYTQGNTKIKMYHGGGYSRWDTHPSHTLYSYQFDIFVETTSIDYN